MVKSPGNRKAGHLSPAGDTASAAEYVPKRVPPGSGGVDMSITQANSVHNFYHIVGIVVDDYSRWPMLRPNYSGQNYPSESRSHFSLLLQACLFIILASVRRATSDGLTPG